jgi:hypothetical protein
LAKFGKLRNVWDWFHRPRTGKFWLLAGAAGVAVLAGIRLVVNVVEWWGGKVKACPESLIVGNSRLP